MSSTGASLSCKIENYYLEHVVFDRTNRDEFIEGLKELCSFDDDFGGETSKEYCWLTTKAAGFSSNRDFLLSHIDKMAYKEFIQYFISSWLGNDNFFKSYSYDIEEKGNIISIALVAMH